METPPLTCTITGGPANVGPVPCSCVGCTAAAQRQQIQAAIDKGREAADRLRRSGAFGPGRASNVRFR